jgi:hypothetical protein
MRKVRIEAPVQIINFEKNEVCVLLPLTYPTGRASQFWICKNRPHEICIRIAAIRIISTNLTSGKVAMKCAALLKGSGSLPRSIRFIIRCTGRNNIRNNPASAIMNFLEIDEAITLFIGSEIFKCLFQV